MSIPRLLCASATAALAWSLLSAPVLAQKPPELVASTEPREPEAEKAAFHLPPGFEAQLVAREPDVHKPMNLSFDDRGRLWVTSSLEYPFPAKDGAKARDKVVILDDFAPDGRARKVIDFADGLNIPIGVLPLSPKEALVHSIPKIRRYVDTDGDGRADRVEDAYSSIGFVDTHGMASHFTRGFDGWIYACHGFANTSSVKGSDGRPVAMQSGNTFRMRPDGSHVEQWTWGQVNPFGLAFDPLGNIFTCDCHSRPIYQILRGAYYPSFGKPDDGLGFGPEMMTHDHGSTGIGGIAYYAADAFPKAYRDTIFIGNVVTSRINRDHLEPHGSTLLAIPEPDFLASDDPWFRPVDMTIGPDGALYVADFYNRIIGHYEVPLTHPGRDRERGRIWRIVYKGTDAKPSPARADWTKATDAELFDDLGHPNLSVRMRAANLLVERGGDEVLGRLAGAVTSPESPDRRVQALWVLERRGKLSPELLAKAEKDSDRSVRVHAMRVLSERGPWTADDASSAQAHLRDDDAFVRRAAADALGQHPSIENVKPLLALRQGVKPDDTHLLHVARIALRNQLREPGAFSKLDKISLTKRDHRDLADVALGVPNADSARFLSLHLRAGVESGDTLSRMMHHIARYGEKEVVDESMAFAQAERPDDLGRQAALLRAAFQGLQERGAGLTGTAKDWAMALTTRLVGSDRDADVLSGVELAGQLKVAELRPVLGRLVASKTAPENRRAAALNALAAMSSPSPVGLLGTILADPSESPALREQAAGILSRLNQGEAIDRLLAALPLVPGRIQSAIAVGLAARRPGADRLLESIAAGKASARLLQERPVQVQLEQAGVPDVAGRVAGLLKDLPPAEQAIQDLIRARREGIAKRSGDAGRGLAVFEKTCAACHQIGGKGARVGPQLDGIGVRGADRLIEDLLDPNRNVDQAFRVTQVALKNGQIVSGLLLREEGNVLVIADVQGKEQRVDKDAVEERRVAQLSPMPANLSDQIPESSFADLIAYLLTQTERRESR